MNPGALQAMLLIPRSPTPLPVEERPVEELNVEELRELARKQRVLSKYFSVFLIDH